MKHNDQIRVLFICNENAARSQIAEAILKQLGGERFTVESAGFEPGPVNPHAVRAMHEAGIDIAGAKSKGVFELYRAGRAYDFVVAVCDKVTGEKCPIFPGMRSQRLDWSFPDPTTFVGSETAKYDQMLELRDSIRARIVDWLVEIT